MKRNPIIATLILLTVVLITGCMSGCAMFEEKAGFTKEDQGEIAAIFVRSYIHDSDNPVHSAAVVVSVADALESLAKAGITGDILRTGLTEWADKNIKDEFNREQSKSLIRIATSRIKDVDVVSERDVEYLQAVATAVRAAAHGMVGSPSG